MERARCVHCRTEVQVPDSYAHGDHIKCATCGTQHKIQRSEGLRLVLADIGPLKEALRENQQRVAMLETELRHSRASFGIGANGLGVGVAWILYETGLKDAVLNSHLLWDGASVALAAAVALEVANYLFLAKRKAIRRISFEIDDLLDEGRQLQKKIREAGRG
jgi:hypothetical protein